MKPMIVAFVALAVISVGANIILERAGFSAADQTSSTAVRLD